MWTWLKSIFKDPKGIIRMVVDALDLAVPLLAIQIDEIKDKFNKMTSTEQAQFAIDWVQGHLRKLFKLEP